jgi:crossover junction endodeoxyribonuclease RuvC
MKVLGIDPSLKSTGYGIIEFANNEYSVLAYGCILHNKINAIRSHLEKIIESHGIDEAAIENPFYAQNVKTAITLGQVRGAALIAVAECECPLFEYSALEIKKAATGYGQADKNQVLIMIKTLLDIQDDSLETDAADALAAAFCHINTRSSPLQK